MCICSSTLVPENWRDVMTLAGPVAMPVGQVLGAASMQAPYGAYWTSGDVTGFGGSMSNGVSAPSPDTASVA